MECSTLTTFKHLLVKEISVKSYFLNLVANLEVFLCAFKIVNLVGDALFMQIFYCQFADLFER
jgi:hypothetical protein